MLSGHVYDGAHFISVCIYHLRQHTWFLYYLIFPGFEVLDAWCISTYLPTSIKKTYGGTLIEFSPLTFLVCRAEYLHVVNRPVTTTLQSYSMYIYIRCNMWALAWATPVLAYRSFVCVNYGEFSIKAKCLLGLHVIGHLHTFITILWFSWQCVRLNSERTFNGHSIWFYVGWAKPVIHVGVLNVSQCWYLQRNIWDYGG